MNLDRILSISAIFISSLAVAPDFYDLWTKTRSVEHVVKFTKPSISLSKGRSSLLAVPMNVEFQVSNNSSRRITLTSIGCRIEVDMGGYQTLGDCLPEEDRFNAIAANGSFVELDAGSAARFQFRSGLPALQTSLSITFNEQYPEYDFSDFVNYLQTVYDLHYYSPIDSGNYVGVKVFQPYEDKNKRGLSLVLSDVIAGDRVKLYTAYLTIYGETNEGRLPRRRYEVIMRVYRGTAIEPADPALDHLFPRMMDVKQK